MKKTNIMLLTSSLNIGGAERQAYNLVTNIDKQKYKVVVACLYDIGETGKNLLKTQENTEVYFNIMKHKADLLGVWKLIRIMKDNEIDILFIVHNPLTLFWGAFSAKIASIKATVTRVTSTNPSQKIKRRKVVNFFMLAFIDKIIAQAHLHRKYLVEKEKIDFNKIIVIHNSVDLLDTADTFNELNFKKSIGVPVQSPVVGIVANLRPEKGHKFFLEAAKTVLMTMPETQFIIVGDGSERVVLEKLSDELGIWSHTHFLGMRNDVHQIISLFDVGVLASSPRVETFSNTVLEYMAESKPVVVTKVGSIEEQVLDGETGLIIPPENAQALAEAILKVLKNRGLARKMGEAGKKMVLEKFSIQKMIAKYEALFTDLMKRANDGEESN